MGNIIEKIEEDREEYERLCSKFGETVQYKKDAYGYKSPDCYGQHARTLRDKVKS